MMKSSLIRINLTFILLALFIPNLTSAESKIFIKEYTYQASEDDSRNSSRTIAMREVKRLLLEELGMYLESVTEVQNFQLTKDQITTLTAGIVKTEIVDENWDGHTYWLKSKIAADTGDVIKSIDALRKDRVKTKDLEEVRRRSDRLLKENERLRKDLVAAKGKEKKKKEVAYNRTIQELSAIEWLEKGYSSAVTSGNYNDAIDAFSKSIELNPKDANAYYNRGVTYGVLSNNKQAIEDYNRAIELNPKLANAYYNRGNAYGKLGNYKQAIQDFNKGIKLNPKDADAYYDRGLTCGKLGNYKQAIQDYSRAIKLHPKDAKIYSNRGNAYGELGNHNQAIEDYNRAIKLDPTYAAIAYYNRGLAYGKLGNYNQAIQDLKIASRLGNKVAQDILRRQGIDW